MRTQPDETAPNRFAPWRKKLWHIIFEHSTSMSKGFDIVLMLAIILSVLVVMLESVVPFNEKHGDLLLKAEWFFTILFTVEYFLRLIATRNPRRYAFSFFGIVDLLSFIPTYIDHFFLTSVSYFLVIRIFRLLRIFRILKMLTFIGEGSVLVKALMKSRTKIFIFMFFIAILVTILGSVMYIVESGRNGEKFSSIPTSIYWAIVTITTVGYGDITPITELGKVISAFVMLLGYAIIAIPTGIVVGEVIGEFKNTPASGRACPNCGIEGHEDRAKFCRRCATPLEDLKD
jgi:voltage-gated potassium channel